MCNHKNNFLLITSRNRKFGTNIDYAYNTNCACRIALKLAKTKYFNGVKIWDCVWMTNII